MNKRSYFQNFVDGKDTQDVFIMENSKTQCIGVEVDGFIYYIAVASDKKYCCVAVGINDLRDVFEAIYEFSEPRFNKLAEYCPHLCQSILDGANDRLDRGAIVEVDNFFMLAKGINYDFMAGLKSDPSCVFDFDSVIGEVVLELIEMVTKMCDEVKEWGGFSNFEEIVISAKEALPGIKWGLSIGTLFG